MGENASLMPPRYGSSLVPFFPRNSARRDPAPACQIVNVPTAYHLQMLPRVVCNFYAVSKLSVSKRNKQGGHVYLVLVDQGLDFEIIRPAVLQIFFLTCSLQNLTAQQQPKTSFLVETATDFSTNKTVFFFDVEHLRSIKLERHI
jgi:hypothetical protein